MSKSRPKFISFPKDFITDQQIDEWAESVWDSFMEASREIPTDLNGSHAKGQGKEMISREERLKRTQKAYEEWSEKTPFVSEDEASDVDESKFVEILLNVDPDLRRFQNDD